MSPIAGTLEFRSARIFARSEDRRLTFASGIDSGRFISENASLAVRVEVVL